MSQAFGRYVIERRLAAGGMGEVSLARQTGPDGFSRVCVIKRMHAALAADSTNVELFLTEARHTAQLNHPHIAQVYDFGKVGDVYYLAMEHVDGPSLAQVLARRTANKAPPLPIGVCCRIAAQVAQALDYAHTAKDGNGAPMKLVHRDVSPSNVLIASSGMAKLIDFGIARGTQALGLTLDGMVRGKVTYMSPEQLRGEPLDGRSDVFALGLVLYQLLTGTSAVRADRVDVTSSVDLVPAAELRADLPEALGRVLETALQKEAAQRYPSAGAMAAALEQVIAGLGVAVTNESIARLARDTVAVAALTGCPDEEVLARLASGTLDEATAAAVRGHLDACERCRELVALAARSAASRTTGPERIGRYEVERSLGTGTMGLVLKAIDRQLDRPVAIKLLLGSGADDSERRARFLREGQAAARVRHPNVVSIYELGFHGDEPFVAMELVEGPTLREWVKARQPGRAAVLALLGEIAAGLDAIHAAGVVHRDVKPENILVDAAGHPRVADFGLARGSSARDLTRTGQLLGTPAYMAPEQLEAGEATPASDQFAFCALALEALVGRRPFEATSIRRLKEEIAAGVSEAAWQGLPRPLRAVLARGLSFEPGRRYASMGELAAELAAAAAPAKAPLRPAARGAVAAGGVALVGALAAVAWPWSRPEPQPPPAAAPAPVVAVSEPPKPEAPPGPKQTEASPAAPPTAPRATGTLAVTSTPAMEVLVDGRSRGETPVRLTLAAGLHRVTLRARDHGLSREEKVEIEAGRARTLDWAPRKVKVEVRAAPPQVEFKVSIDGTPMGATPLAPFSVWEGRRKVSVVSDKGWAAEKVIELKGPSARLKITDGVGVELAKH